MDKEKFKQLVADPRFISGIYNYCDRWCERCPFTSRCLTFAMEQEDQLHPSSRNLKNDAFWEKLDNLLQQTLDFLDEIAAERGIDLADEESDEIAQERQHRTDRAKSHPLSRAAHKYSKMVNHWFETNQQLFQQRGHELSKKLKIGIPKKQINNEAESILDAIKVIEWYQYQIYVKLMRALIQVQYDDCDEIMNLKIKDANGSVKVALIGMDRSITSWAKLYDHFPEQSDQILNILVHLERLRKRTEKQFPNARSFKRPGFDTLVDHVEN